MSACTGVAVFRQECAGWAEHLSSGLAQESLRFAVNTLTDLSCRHPLTVQLLQHMASVIHIFAFSGLSHLSVVSVN